MPRESGEVAPDVIFVAALRSGYCSVRWILLRNALSMVSPRLVVMKRMPR
jgi:hypothetical protein